MCVAVRFSEISLGGKTDTKGNLKKALFFMQQKSKFCLFHRTKCLPTHHPEAQKVGRKDLFTSANIKHHELLI